MNPEFRRNLWTELTTQRLVVAPVIIGLLYYCTRMLPGGQDYASNIFLGLGALICLMGGWPLAYNSVLDEQREHTWDNQRMSSLGAWPMCWGKIFGATIFPWYGAFLSFFGYLVGFESSLSLSSRLKLVALIILFAVFVHSVVFIASLEISRAEARKISGKQWLGVLVLVLASPFSLIFRSSTSALIESTQIVWYSTRFQAIDFVLESMLVFTLWGLFGCYRSMRTELLHRSPPIAWLAFLIFQMFYWNGFTWMAASMFTQLYSQAPPDLGLRASILVSFAIAIGSAWALILTEKKDIVQLRKFFSGQKLHSRFSLMPKWLVSAVLSGLLFIGLQMYPITAVEGFQKITEGISFFTAGLLLFFLRDTFIVLWCHCTAKFKNRAGMASLIYLVLLYTLIPWTFAAVAGPSILPWIVPSPFASIQSLAGVGCQALFMAFVFWRRWVGLNAKLSAASSGAVAVRP